MFSSYKMSTEDSNNNRWDWRQSGLKLNTRLGSLFFRQFPALLLLTAAPTAPLRLGGRKG